MHPNPTFRTTSHDRNLAFVRARAFGTLAVNAPDGPLLSHVPVLLSDDAATVDLHLVRSNPILRAAPCDAVISVMGPDGYVSPDWYGVDDQVPTWNYVAVHLRGSLRMLDPEEMRDMLDRQSADAEAHLAPKPPWQVAKMTPDVRDRMMRQILPCRMAVTSVVATWKVSQNKPDAVRQRAADGLERAALQPDASDLAALMRDPPA
ncbi:FMN-binding negative transcriptional regulator [Jannaschia donghaensis]|uniref:Protease synthase and sporulation protein PAI 2 n=1 Tax=Jannaschia donghaensis TaxID=420998 RepID=A0A0M6YH71_9RHOB|nr:FMN-binding negative transcriptional regulator [Jannaschia donghaensis]CTQ49264.1 Protease synthase and sporulation protein PAI 2 [Jannaschia donghaensis]